MPANSSKGQNILQIQSLLLVKLQWTFARINTFRAVLLSCVSFLPTTRKYIFMNIGSWEFFSKLFVIISMYSIS